MHEPEGDQQPEAGRRERKPYAAPRIEESARFEHLVLACAMVLPGTPECMPGPSQSM